MLNNNYNRWKDEINNHPEVIKRGEILTNRNNLIIRNKSTWDMFRDSVFMLLIFIILIIISMRTLYPDAYKDMVNHVCNPTMNYTDNTINFNNASCINSCICDFPNKIKVEIINGS